MTVLIKQPEQPVPTHKLGTVKDRTLHLNGHVGFDTLPDQIVSKSVSDGFTFNILCIGETGIGKSTLIDTLFNTKFDWEESSHLEPKVRLNKSTYDLNESNVRMKLSIVETVGFGDQLDKEESYSIVKNYLDAQFECFLQEELKIKRNFSILNDTRVHCCLYFICPTGHSLKILDVMIMKKLDKHVNIIPVIAKADMIAKNELVKFKQNIMRDISAHGIRIYQFPIDDDMIELNTGMNSHMPFAVVGSSDMVKVGTKLVRARQYPWGVVVVDNEAHNDFVKLREMLIRTNMQDLIETTHNKHYECYRSQRLGELGFADSMSSVNGKSMSISESYEAKHTEQKADIQKKEDEIKEAFVAKVKAKEAELKDAERELHDKFTMLKKQHSEQKERVEDKKRLVEDEMKEFQRRKFALETSKTSSIGTLKGKKK